jgi:hypothetical protein
MEDVEFSDEFCRFIQTTVPAVDAAELLLLLRGKPEAGFSAEEAVAKLGPGITISEASRHLEQFQSKGLVEKVENKFRYLPNSVLAPKVDTLAQAYQTRPVTLIRVIYALRDSKIQNFADAFRIRKP